MIFCYDLEVSPETFDVAGALTLAFAHANELKTCVTDIAIIPGKKSGFRSSVDHYHLSEQQWRLSELVLPICRACAPTASLHLFSSRREAALWLEAQAPQQPRFPSNYTINKPVSRFAISDISTAAKSKFKLPKWEADPYALKILTERLQGIGIRSEKGFVSITLRQTHSFSKRNSDIAQWKKVASWLTSNGYKPIIVPDTETASIANQSWGSESILTETSYNIKLRHALYQLCSLNLFVNNGPAILCYQSLFPYLAFKLVTQGVSISDLSYFAKEGFYPAQNWPQATPEQKLIWEDDNAETIIESIMEWQRSQAGEPTTLQQWDAKIRKALDENDTDRVARDSAVAAAFTEDRAKALGLRAGALLSLQRWTESLLTTAAAWDESQDMNSFRQILAQWKHHAIPGHFEIVERFAKERIPLVDKRGNLLPLGKLVQNIVDRTRRRPAAKEIYIYGAGAYGRQAMSQLNKTRAILGFCDSNPQLHGKHIENIKVFSPEVLLQNVQSDIVIASMHADEIMEKLVSLGISLDRISFAREFSPL